MNKERLTYQNHKIYTNYAYNCYHFLHHYVFHQ